MKFEKLKKGNISEIENDYINKWQEIDILNKCNENKSEEDNWVFYDGPIYANAKPGIHHVFSKTIKDSFCKYQSMQGKRVIRKLGLDTHGLPIEVNVEKKFGFKSKSDIEKFGIKNFCTECNIETTSNIDEVNKVTNMMGQFIDSKNPYITCKNDYIETEWWILKTLDEKGLLYHGNKVLPYCPRCGTELASFEVSQGYQDDSVNTVIVPFELEDEDTYLLVWTTTPWTLLDNVAACVNPNFEYVKVKSRGINFIVCKTLADSVLGDDYEILETYKGSDLTHKKYKQFMPFAKINGNAFEIVSDDYVTDESGTGIVHIAPAYGEDDNKVCKKENLAFSQNVDKNGRYTTGPWEGRVVTDKDLEIDIIKYLKENDKLFKKQKLVHSYPHCWRCKSPLIYYAKPAWYIATTKKKKEIIEANKKIEWYPAFVGEKRFNNWLENMVDWGISRNRYWGCPMPIWTCECGNYEVIGSAKELQDKIIEDIDISKLEFHRPYIDQLHIKCKCGKTMNRISDVLDVWFDSGAMPYAQYHYPFENKELFESQFPADFIAEGVDQTRGWFYVLLVLSTLISGKSSFKRVVVNDLMLDAKGKKMSKSVGNIIKPEEIMSKYGADTIRFYMMYVSPVWTPLKFDEEGVKEVYSKYISTFKNAYSFFEIYANADNIDPRNYYIEVKDRELIDKWLLSKLNKLIKNVKEAYDEFDLNKVAKLIVPFINDDLSNWYIRSNRRRFWDSKLSLSKKSVYLTTYETLVALCKLCAPLTPFITEEIYTKLTKEDSVHLAKFPEYDSKLINEQIENQIDLVRDICSLGRFSREEAKIKVRQPLCEIIVPKETEKDIKQLEFIIKEELNVKNINYSNDLSKYLDYIVKPNFKILGKQLGPKVKILKEELSKLNSKEIDKIKNDKLVIKLEGEAFEITNEKVIIDIKVKDGYTASSDNKTVVVLNTNLTNDLLLEGLAREFVRTVQNLRKEKDFVITDHINIYYKASDRIKEMLNKYESYIKNETLAENIIEDAKVNNEYTLNDEKAFIDVSKIK